MLSSISFCPAFDSGDYHAQSSTRLTNRRRQKVHQGVVSAGGLAAIEKPEVSEQGQLVSVAIAAR